MVEGELRFGDKRYPIRKHDVIACPTGGPEVETTMRYLALSILADLDTCEYPDSRKCSSSPDCVAKRVQKMFRAENTVDYYDRDRH